MKSIYDKNFNHTGYIGGGEGSVIGFVLLVIIVVGAIINWTTGGMLYLSKYQAMDFPYNIVNGYYYWLIIFIGIVFLIAISILLSPIVLLLILLFMLFDKDFYSEMTPYEKIGILTFLTLSYFGIVRLCWFFLSRISDLFERYPTLNRVSYIALFTIIFLPLGLLFWR